jgi:hypothetical protein
MHDLHELLPRAHRLERRDADGLLPHPVRERPGELEADVRFEQDAPDLAQSLVHRLFGKYATTGEIPQCGGQSFRERGEHRAFKYRPLGPEWAGAGSHLA